MGITLSHTAFSPLSLISTIFGFISFALTLSTLLKVSWGNLATFSTAPHEINDYFSSLKQGLLEERRHLRRVRKRLRSVRRDRSHGPGVTSGSEEDHYGKSGGRGGGTRKRSRRGRKRGQMHFDRDIQSMRSTGEDEAVSVMRVTVRDLIQKFRELEDPFLKDEYKQRASGQWSTTNNNYPQEKSPYYSQHPNSDDDSGAANHLRSTNRLGHEYKNCGFKERWLWVRRKSAVINLSVVLNRVEVRRTAHEVGEILSMMCNLGRDVEDLSSTIEGVEGRLNRVVGVRRIE
jgi:hypothetical protein